MLWKTSTLRSINWLAITCQVLLFPRWVCLASNTIFSIWETFYKKLKACLVLMYLLAVIGSLLLLFLVVHPPHLCILMVRKAYSKLYEYELELFLTLFNNFWAKTGMGFVPFIRNNSYSFLILKIKRDRRRIW